MKNIQRSLPDRAALSCVKFGLHNTFAAVELTLIGSEIAVVSPIFCLSALALPLVSALSFVASVRRRYGLHAATTRRLQGRGFPPTVPSQMISLNSPVRNSAVSHRRRPVAVVTDPTLQQSVLLPAFLGCYVKCVQPDVF